MNISTGANWADATAPIGDSDIISRGEAAGSAFVGVLGQAMTSRETRRAARFARPNSMYGLRYIPKSVAALNYRPSAGMDLYVVDRTGVLSNSSDDLGRSDPLAVSRPLSEAPLVAMYGGSTMMGMGSRLPEFSIPALTEKVLREEFGLEARCVNYGIGGTSSVEALTLLMYEVCAKNPRINVFYDGWNDCSYFATLSATVLRTESFLSVQARQAVDMRQLELNLALPVLSSFRRSLGLAMRIGANSSATGLAQLLPRGLRRKGERAIANAFPIGIHREYENLREPISDDELLDAAPNAVAKYVTVHRAAQFISRESGAAFIHALQPLSFWGRKPRTAREDEYALSGWSTGPTAAFFPFKASVLETLSRELVDLTDIFADVHDEVYIDSGHLNRLGNLIVARHLASLLAPHLRGDQ